MPDGTTLNNLYYGSGHLYNQSLTDNQGNIHELRHSQKDSLHQEVLRQHGQNHHTAFDYDPMGRLTQSHTSSPNHIIKQAFYTYDKKGQLTQLNTSTRLGQQTRNVPMGQAHPNQAQRFNRTHQYIYDKVGRLTEHKLTDHQAHTGHTEVFGFDPASNRVPLPQTSQANSQEVHNKTHRPTKLISQNKEISYTYDVHGNIKTKTETPIDSKIGEPIYQYQNGLIGYQKSIQFTYNPNNELKQTIIITDTGLEVQRTTTDYFYDAFGRRIGKRSKTEQLSKLNQRGELVKHPTALIHLRKTDKSKYSSTLMLWEGNRQIQEYTNDFVFTTVYDQDSFEPISRLLQDRQDTSQIKVYHYHNNHLGTPQELTDDCGNVIWANYEFAWGGRYTHFYKEQSLNNCDILEQELQPIRFQGQFYEVETRLHYNRFRYYDSDVGMFIQRDPIGLLGGTNIFQYAPNPVGWVDPWGLVKLRPTDPKMGSLDNDLVRCWYKREESRISQMLDCCKNQKEKARLAHKLRNEARIRARLLMKDREAAKSLYTGINSPTGKAEPMLTWKKAVQKAKNKGLRGNDIYADIIGSSSKSRKSIDDKLLGGKDCESLLKKAGI